MSEKIGRIKTLLLILIVVEVLGLVCLYFLFDLDIKIAALYFIIKNRIMRMASLVEVEVENIITTLYLEEDNSKGTDVSK